ncbi:hypothetical protein NIES4101_70890 [Calothrix sp. NIES-4101]|nr:hypothetical protein NIES4101_70890 [Calothrix sp. NIES-4101]
MDLINLKWTKNVKHPDSKLWAYPNVNTGDLFKLSWKDNTSNADKPDKDDLILLRQKGYVTHLVKVLDYKHEKYPWEGDYNIYRIVETIWAINCHHPLISAKADIVFGYPEVLSYEGGNVMELETLPTFKTYWDSNGGFQEFKNRVCTMLNLSSN